MSQENISQSLKSLTKDSRGLLFLSIIFSSCSSLLMITQMFIIAKIIASIAFSQARFTEEFYLIKDLVIIVLFKIIINALADIINEYLAIKITSNLKMRVISHLFRLGPIPLIQYNSGHIATLLSEGIDALRPYLSRYMPRSIAMVTVPIFILIIAFYFDKISFLTLLITGPLIPFFMVLVGYGAKKIMDKKWYELLFLSSSFLDMLQGLTTIRLFGREKEATKFIEDVAIAHRNSTMAIMKIAFLTTASLEFFSSLAIASVAIFFGTRLLTGHACFETAFFILLLAPEYFLPLKTFSASYHDKKNAESAFKPISEILSLPTYVTPKKPLQNAPKIKVIDIINLSLCYPLSNKKILKNISARFSANTLTAITGKSGAGKTTLLRALGGLLPIKEGKIIALNTEDATIPLSALSIGWISQKPFFLAKTIKENLCLGHPNASDADINEACEKAGALEFIKNLPDQFLTCLGDYGAPLSAGEIRRLALARALLHNPEVLLFDEPTADLDEINAEKVIQSIMAIHHDKIIIIISHREDILKKVHHIFELKNGDLISLTAEHKKEINNEK